MSHLQAFKQTVKSKQVNKLASLTGSSSFAYTTLNKTLKNQTAVFHRQGYTFVQYTSPDFVKNEEGIQYAKGFRNTHWLELKDGVIPKHTNPKYPPFSLVTEQITGPQGFTGEASSGGPLKTWLYKKERSIKIGPYAPAQNQPFYQQEYINPGPNPIRFAPPAAPTKPTPFLEGLIPIAKNEHVLHYQYSINKSMKDELQVFHNIDGEMLVQPSIGALEIVTELGILEVQPGTVAVITKNIKFQVNLKEGTEVAQGVITELKNDRSFRLPHRGPIGANGLANSEYFENPVPWVDSVNFNKTHKVVTKKQDQFYEAEQQNSPFDVYGWKGNYSPYRFNLDDFVPITAGRKDHLDPSSHLVLAVAGQDGANLVELVAFVPRVNATTNEQPTYLPPYDHRNNGKAEIMHYLGGYDARVGTSAGYQTIHDMGVTHGNDQATFEKARSGENKTVFLDHSPATMVELTSYLEVAPHVLQNQDSDYLAQLRGDGSKPTSQIKRTEQFVGFMKKITFTAFESSVIPIFEVLMPNPDVTFNEKTGVQTRQYRNSRGDIFEVQSQFDQNAFWTLFKQEEDGPVDFSKAKRDVKSASNEELTVAANVLKSFFNRGTVISSVDLECEDPVASKNYFLANGFVEGQDKDCIALNENAPLNFRLIKKGDFEIRPNPESQVSTIDHTVINVFRKQLPQMFALFPDEFWGGDPRDLRAHGVQFDTRVLTSKVEDVQVLVPVNNLDATEEEILDRIQDKDTYLPPYIEAAAMGNQITRGLYDTNRTLPQNSKDGFLQHIAMGLNTQYGDVSYHLENFRKQGLTQIPPPPQAYYDLSEVDLSQRVLLPTLFNMAGVDAFSLPYTFFNGLLKPKDADVNRLNELLVKDNQWEQSRADVVVNAYKQIQPVLALVGDSVSEFNEANFKSQLESTFQAQNISFNSESIETITKLINFNKKKVERSAEVGSLLDFQIINVGGNNQTGYLDQTFSVPITQKNEGTSGIFLEFLVRTSYEEIFELIEQGKFYNEKVEWKCCGAFGQGNFGNLMLGQQLGIKKVDEELKKKQQQQGFAFKLPMLDYNTITSSPLDHLYEHIDQVKGRGELENAEKMSGVVDNIKELIEECKNRNLWN